MVFRNGARLSCPEERIREYAEIEIYGGYDDRHNITDNVTVEDLEAANKLYAMIDRYGMNEGRAIMNRLSISPLLSKIGDVELDSLSGSDWQDTLTKTNALLSEFLSIPWVGLAKAMNVLHLKGPIFFLYSTHS